VSTEAIAPALPANELAIGQRIAQLQALIERTDQAASGAGSVSSATTSAPSSGAQSRSFAQALQAASISPSQSTPATALASSSGTAQSSSPYDPMIEAAAQRYGLDPAVLHGLIQQESGFDPNAQSGAGASGLTQLMPATASSLGVANPLDPAESIAGGARYLSGLMSHFAGNTAEALAAYNAGPGAVQQYGGVPPYAETQSYV